MTIRPAGSEDQEALVKLITRFREALSRLHGRASSINFEAAQMELRRARPGENTSEKSGLENTSSTVEVMLSVF